MSLAQSLVHAFRSPAHWRACVFLLAGFALFQSQPAFSQSKIFYISNSNASILEAELDGSNPATVYEGMPAPNGMDVDAASGKIYWVDGILGKIYRANTDGTSQETLVSGLAGPSDVALDLVNSKMYWTDLNAGEIGRANLDGTTVETLLTGLSGPVAIDVDGTGAKFYWTDTTDGTVKRNNLDGSSEETIRSGMFGGVSAVALDLTNSKVYWIDAFGQIDRSDLDGANYENLSFEVGDFMDIDAAGGKIYWTDQLGQQVNRSDLDGTNVENIVTGLDGPIGIGLDLTNSKVYWVDPMAANRVQRANLDGTTVEAIITPEIASAGDLTVHSGKIYWTDNKTGKVRRANVDFTSPEDLVTGLTTPIGIRVDGSASKMYWIDAGTSKIQRADLDGSNSEDLVTGLTAPRHLDLDVSGGKMYWTDGTDGEVRSANLDGSSPGAVVTGLTSPFGIAVGSLYWADNGAIQTSANDGSGQSTLVSQVSIHGVALDATGGKVYYIEDAFGQLRRMDTDGSNDELLISGLFGPTDLALSIETSLTESTVASGLSGSTPAVASAEVQIFAIGITGDGSTTVNSIDLTLSDLTSATGLAASDISELRLYSSTDVLLDGGDTQIGNETTINIGSATTISATTPNLPGNGTEVFYLVSAVIAAAPTGGHTFRVGFAANGVTTSGSALGTAVAAADANNVSILHLTESTAAAGLSGSSTTVASGEVQVFSVGITGDGVSSVFGVDITLSDLTSATGLAAGDFSELRLYTSTDATLDGGDTEIGSETTINIGSATTIAATTPNVPANGTEVFYLVSAVVAASPTGGHTFRAGFATNGVTTSLGFLGTAVAAADADNVTILDLTESTAAAGLSGASTAVANAEVQLLSVGITGDGTSTVNSVAVTLSDLTSATGLAASDFAELRLYTSTDATLDGGDTEIGDQTSINIGSATTISATTPDTPANGTEVFYLVAAVIAASPTNDHAFRVGFAANGVTTSLGTLGTAVAAADADKVTLVQLAETTAATGLSGSSTAVANGEVQLFSVGLTGDGTTTVNSVAITLSDLTSATGLAAADFAELRLYTSTDATLDGGDTEIGDQTSINIGSATTISATTPDTPANGTEVFYLVAAVIAASPTDGHAFRVGFAANGVTTSLGALGTAVTAADADRFTIAQVGETTAAAGLSGSSTAVANGEVQLYSIGITGDGVSTVNSIAITLSDLTSATGLAASDFTELRLYTSTDATLDGGDTEIGDQTSINIGSATTVSATTPNTPANGTEVFYLISAVIASSPTGGHAFRVGFAANGVTTSGVALGTAVTAADADNVTILRLTESTAAAGLSGTSTTVASGEVQLLSVGITGDGTSTVNSVAVTLSDLTSATGLAASDFAELRLYSSTDATLDGGDTEIGDQTTINIGSATTISATTPDTPGSGSEVFYIISAVVAAGPTGGHAFRVGFAANGVTTSLGSLGTAVSAADADNVTILRLTESTAAVGLSGTTTAFPDDEVQLLSIGVTGDGTSTVNSVAVTLSDLTSATGLAAADLAELRLYTSTDATLDGGDTEIGDQTTINIGSATTISATTPDTPGSGSEVFYLVSAVIASSPTTAHALRVGVAANGVTTSLGTLGTAVTAADADNVTITVPVVSALVFTTQPGNTSHLGTVSVVVEARDNLNVIDNTFSDPVTLTLSPSGSLTGATVSAVNGVATFTGMTISGAGSGRTLVASGGGVNGTSNSFTVAKAEADIILSGVAAAYSGEGRGATITTDPTGLTVTATYGGSTDLPIDPGAYDLIVEVVDDDYQGRVTNVFRISDPPPPVVKFEASVTTGLTPLAVTFRDSVTGFVTQRIFELFDDESTVLIDPDDAVTVTYSQAGTYNASLVFRAIGVRRGERRIPITAYSLETVDDQITDEGLTVTIPLLAVEALDIVDLTVEPELPGMSLVDGVWSWKTNLEQAGVYTITATATDNLGTRQTRSFTVVVNESQPPILTPNPEKLDFGNVLAGYSLEVSVDLTNPSDLPVTLEALELESPAFTLFPPDMPVTLAPDSSVTFRARYDANWGDRPSVAAVEASTDHGQFFMPIAGRSLWAALEPDTERLDFEEILPGDDAELHFYVDNTGTIPVRGVAQIDAPSFEVSPQMFTIEPGLSERLTVTFSPVEADNHEASLRFVDVEPVVGPTLALDPIAVPNPGTLPVDDDTSDESLTDASGSRLEKRVAGLQFEDVPIPVVGFASRLVVADFNRDRVVDMADFQAFHKAVFRDITPQTAVFDLTLDGRIDVADLFRFSDVFGEVTPRILARPDRLDATSREHLTLYGRAIGSMTADLGSGALRPGRTVNHTQFGTSAALAIDVQVPVQLGMSHVQSGTASFDGLSAQLVITGTSRPEQLAPHSDKLDYRPASLPVTGIPIGFVTTEGEELALHGNVVTLPGGRARFDFGPLRSSWQPSIQEEIRRTRDFRPDLTRAAIEAHCGGSRYVSVDKVFSATYDSGLRTEAIGERYGIVATNSVAYDCETQKFAADFILHYFRSAQSANGPALSEDFVVSESLLR